MTHLLEFIRIATATKVFQTINLVVDGNSETKKGRGRGATQNTNPFFWGGRGAG